MTKKMTKCNLYKPGSAKYYRDVLFNISAVAWNYDCYNPKSAKQMKGLVDELKSMADDALKHKKLYIQVKNQKG